MSNRILKHLWLDLMPGSHIIDVISTAVQIVKMTEVEKVHFKFNDFDLTVDSTDTVENVARKYDEARMSYVKAHS
jgi:hypothetical protein